MNQPLLLATITSALVLLPGAASSPAPSPGSPRLSPAAPAVQEELDRAAFMKKIRKAMEIKATEEMANIVRRNPTTALFSIIEFGEQISLRTNDQLETDMSALINAWKDAFDSEFGMIMYEYFSLMKVQVRAFRSQRIGDFKQVEREYDAAVEAKNWDNLDAACAKYEQLAVAFENAGDHYYVSECWWRAGWGYDTGVRGNHAKIEKAGEAYVRTVEARKRIQLEDLVYTQAKTRADQLLGQVKQEQEKAKKGEAEGFTRRIAGVSLGKEVRHVLAFEMVEQPESIFRPGYVNHDLAPVWSSLTFGKPGTTSVIASFNDGPQGIRVGGGVLIDIERDGRGDVDVPLTGNIEPVVMTLGEGDSLRQWGFLTQLLGNQELYQGIGISLEASEAFLNLYIAPGASMVGEVDGTAFRVIDENMDGYYGSAPLYWGYVGLTKGNLQPVYDTVVLGTSRRAVPWSEYMQIGPEWYQVLSDKFGTEVVTSRAKLETGKLKLAFKGETPEYLIVKGTGTFQYSYFDVLAEGKKGIEVPAGAYTLMAGELRKGKRTQVMKALILPGSTTPSWTVNPGETTTIELGAPFSFDYQVEQSGDKLKILGNSVAVTGKAGERYERLWNCTVHPEVQLRKVGTKKSGRPQKMAAVLDRDTIVNEGFAVAWFPRDLELEKRDADDRVELLFNLKKNKLFGTIESGWKPLED